MTHWMGLIIRFSDLNDRVERKTEIGPGRCYFIDSCCFRQIVRKTIVSKVRGRKRLRPSTTRRRNNPRIYRRKGQGTREYMYIESMSRPTYLPNDTTPCACEFFIGKSVGSRFTNWWVRKEENKTTKERKKDYEIKVRNFTSMHENIRLQRHICVVKWLNSRDLTNNLFAIYKL